MTQVAHPTSPSFEVRARLSHPVIDADAHSMELIPLLAEYVEREGVDSVDPLLASASTVHGPDVLRGDLGSHDRRARRSWSSSSLHGLGGPDAVDFATCRLPALLYDRLDELGLDYAVLYPSIGLPYPHLEPMELRVPLCRALNRYHSDLYADYRDRLDPVAVIPLHTPDEGIAALDHAVLELGFKSILIPSYVRRPIAEFGDLDPLAQRYASWLDTYAIESPYDYDPFWARCAELRVPIAAHSPGMGVGTRTSTANVTYNHIGHFASSGEALAKALVLGGVLARFETLRFALLEGGVGWAASLYADLLGHWEHFGPGRPSTKMDFERLEDLLERFGVGPIADLRRRAPSVWGVDRPRAPMADNRKAERTVGDFARCGASNARELAELFTSRLFFGCEADDPLTAWAFSGLLPYGARLAAMLGSDIGHPDVAVMNEVLAEAHELVDEGRLGPEEFAALTCGNAFRFLTESNPSYFDGTALDSYARTLLREGSTNADV